MSWREFDININRQCLLINGFINEEERETYSVIPLVETKRANITKLAHSETRFNNTVV